MAQKLNIPVMNVWNISFSDFFAFLQLSNVEHAYQDKYTRIMNRK